MRMNMLKFVSCFVLLSGLIMPGVILAEDTISPMSNESGKLTSVSVSFIHHDLVQVEINFKEIPDTPILIVETSDDGETWIQEVCIPLGDLNTPSVSANFNSREGQRFLRLIAYDKDMNFIEKIF
jgi:hypothetical protein